MRALPRSCRHGLRVLLLIGGALQAATAWADGSLSTEFWPEINAYLGLGERSRLMFSAAGTRAMEGSVENRILAVQNAQFTLNFDYTLAPILRRDVPGGVVEEPAAVGPTRL